MNASTAENLMRSANEPTIRQQVIAAKVAWNTTKAISGIITPLLNVAALVNVPGVGSKMPLRNSAARSRR